MSDLVDVIDDMVQKSGITVIDAISCIAQQRGVAEGTVRSSYYRAKKKKKKSSA